MQRKRLVRSDAPPAPGDIAWGDTTLRFPLDVPAGRIALQMFPSALARSLAKPRSGLAGLPFIDAIPHGEGYNPPARVLESLAQVKLVGDTYPGGFSQGHTMRNSDSTRAFRFEKQRVRRAKGGATVTTELVDGAGHRIEHRLAWRDDDQVAEVTTTFVNESDRPVVLEMLSSFSLSGITPFHEADAPGRLRVHRFRSGWSAEGRLDTRSIEELHLERSWSGAGAFSERFGQVGSMPVRRWFPFVAIEDTVAGVTWGAQLAWAGSWQMEVFRQHDDVCLSGGLADREFGHWKKSLAPGESLTGPTAWIGCVLGNVDDLCDRFVAVQERAADRQPAVEQKLPVVFNEWATTWGDPQHEKMVQLASRLKGSPVRYLVIDAGWYRSEGTAWWMAQGDWIPSPTLFPRGLEATAAAIRQQGLLPGLWFEFEVAGPGASAFQLTDHLLKRDGVPVASGAKRFWDLNDPWVLRYLGEKVIGLLERCGFGYLKVDYNDTIGIGCDDPDSLGEGLRKQVLGIHRFFDEIRKRLPNLVIESCSSGGHRLEPSMVSRTAMSSFSDAHELPEIPIIAANLHRLIPPRQSQIWAVLHRADSDQRLAYSLSAAFLGRMCLSGELTALTAGQWSLALRAQEFYGRCAPIIKRGVSRRFGDVGASWRYPQGWQAVRRVAGDGRSAMVVIHTFAGAPRKMTVPLTDGAWFVRETFPSVSARVSGPNLICTLDGDFCGAVVLLDRTKSRARAHGRTKSRK